MEPNVNIGPPGQMKFIRGYEYQRFSKRSRRARRVGTTATGALGSMACPGFRSRE